jgi:outer membrane protein assembly factor BamB
LYFGDVSGNVYALDAATQQPLWVTDLSKLAMGGAVRATPLYDGVCLCWHRQWHIVALKADTGQELWPQPFKVPNAQFLTTQLMQDGLLLVAPLGTPTLLYGLDLASGNPPPTTQWQFPVPSGK